MYKVELFHFGPKVINDDVMEFIDLIRAEVFKTKKECKSYIYWQWNGRKYKEKWHRGNEPSYVYYYTDKTFRNENSGETYKEYYYFKITKK